MAASLDSPELFATIFDRHFAATHRYLTRRSDREQANDLASQTFTVAFERRATFETIATSRPGYAAPKGTVIGWAVYSPSRIVNSLPHNSSRACSCVKQ